jgi:hypothetical protein
LAPGTKTHCAGTVKPEKTDDVYKKTVRKAVLCKDFKQVEAMLPFRRGPLAAGGECGDDSLNTFGHIYLFGNIKKERAKTKPHDDNSYTV